MVGHEPLVVAVSFLVSLSNPKRTLSFQSQKRSPISRNTHITIGGVTSNHL